MTTDDRILHRIRALLAKAESTPYAEEAAALTAKAQELIAQHAIDSAMIAEQTGRGEITTRLVFIPAPYPKEKFLLLGGVASANGCRAILGLDDIARESVLESPELFRDDGRYSTIVGYAGDLDATELVFTSLLVQAVNVMLAHGRHIDEWGDNRTRSFRRSFLHSFAWTIRERLAEVRSAAGAAAEAASPGNVLPVLASRSDAVDSFVDDAFPRLTNLRTSVSNFDGVIAGEHAGRRADIGGSRIGRRTTAIR